MKLREALAIVGVIPRIVRWVSVLVKPQRTQLPPPQEDPAPLTWKSVEHIQRQIDSATSHKVDAKLTPYTDEPAPTVDLGLRMRQRKSGGRYD